MPQTASVMLKDRRTATFSCCGKLLVFAQTLRALSFIYDFPSVAFPWGGMTLIKSSGTRRPHRPLILCGSCQHCATHHYISRYKQKWNVAVWEAWASHHNRIRLKICQPDPTMLHNAGWLRGHCCGRVMHSSAAHARLRLHCSTIQGDNFALLTMILKMHAFFLTLRRWASEEIVINQHYLPHIWQFNHNVDD